MSRRVDAIAESLPSVDDIARSSDIPKPPDLAPLHAKIQELATEAAAIRADLTETRQWIADLGRSWQAHRAETSQRVSELADMIDAIPEPVPVEIDERPDQDIIDLRNAISEMRSSIAELTESVPDTAPIAQRVDELAHAIVAVGERIPDKGEIAEISDQVTRLWDALAARTCPDPVDLRPVIQAIDETKRDQEILSNRTCPQPVDLAPVMQAIDEIKHTQSTIRAGLTETRQWLADLGRVVQRGGKS
jgi:hypothetical protein